MKLQNYLIAIFLFVALIAASSAIAVRGISAGASSSGDITAIQTSATGEATSKIDVETKAISDKIKDVSTQMNSAVLWNIIFQAIPGLLDILVSIMAMGITVPINIGTGIMTALQLPEWFKVFVISSITVTIILKIYFIIRGTGEV